MSAPFLAFFPLVAIVFLLTAATPSTAPDGDLNRDGSVNVVDIQCLTLVYEHSSQDEMVVCENDNDCLVVPGGDYTCRQGFAAPSLLCLPACLHPSVSLAASEVAVCDDPGAEDEDCLGLVARHRADLNCDGELSAADFNFLVALSLDKAGGAGTADIDMDGQLNGCDPDGDGDGLENSLDCSPLDPLHSDCDDGNACTLDSCIDELCHQVDSGQCVSGPFVINTTPAGEHSTDTDSTALPDGGFAVVYTAYPDGNDWYPDIYLQRFDPLGQKKGVEVQVNASYSNPDDGPSVAPLPGAGFAVVWRGQGGIRLRRFDPLGGPLGSETVVPVLFNNQSRRPDVVRRPQSGFVVVWDAMKDGSHFSTYARLFDAAGEPVGDDFKVPSSDLGGQVRPAVAATDSTLCYVWDGSGALDDDGGALGRCFGADGVALGDDFQLNQHLPGEQADLDIAALSGGQFIVTWFSELQDGSEYTVYARRLSGAGQPVGDEFRVNQSITLSQDAARVSALSDGGFVVVWHTENYNYSPGFQVHARLFDQGGAPAGDQIVVHGEMADHPWFPDVTTLDGGRFVAFWHSRTPQGKPAALFGRLFDAQGTPD